MNPPKQPDFDTDGERDAWLSEALRHAPDAQLGPPTSLSEMILREAQAKSAPRTRPRQAAVGPPPWRLWAWMGHPAVGATMASVMVATVVGLMWWDHSTEDMQPRSSAPATASDTSGSATPKPTTVPTPAEAPAAQKEPAPASPEPAAPKAPTAGSRLAQRGREPIPAPAPPPAKNSVESASPRAGVAPQAPRREAADNKAVSPAQSATAAAEANTKADRTLDAMAPAAPATGSAVAEDSLSALRAALATEPQRWSWQRGEAVPRPVGEALRAWLAQLDQATASRWQPVQHADAARESRKDAASTTSTEVRLLHDGRDAHLLLLEHTTVRWQITTAEGGMTWRQARLTPQQALALRRALDEAAR